MAGQTVVELQAGGTSLYDSYGGSVHFYTSNYTGWLGVGYQDGFKLGAAVQTSFHQDSLRIGSSVLLQRYATDLFSIGINVLTQDIRYTWVRKRTVVMAAAGSAAAAYGSQFFQAYSFDDPFGALSARHQASRQVNLGFDGVIASKQSAIGSIAYFPRVNLGLAASGGIGSNAPYGAVALEYKTRTLAVRTSYVALGDAFRRADLPYPEQTEAYKENIQVDWQPWTQVSVGVARQNFLQSATDTTPRSVPAATPCMAASPGSASGRRPASTTRTRRGSATSAPTSPLGIPLDSGWTQSSTCSRAGPPSGQRSAPRS